MKSVLISLISLLFFATVSFSQAPGSDTTKTSSGCPHMAMDRGMGMMPRIVATQPDGSIIVMSGALLLKYDQNLKLISKAEVPVDTTSIQKMRQMCPSMQGGQPPQPQQQPGAPAPKSKK